MTSNSPFMKRLLSFIAILITTSLALYAQNAEWSMLHQGNRAFKRGEWTKAETYYRKALKENPRNSRAMFNLGDAYLAQKNGKDALKCFVDAAKAEKNPAVRAMAYHNIGFIHQNNKDYEKAIDAYKEALRNNPHDEDTRYNLALCQKQRQQQQEEQQQEQEQQNQNSGNQSDPQQQDSNRQEQQEEQQMSQDNIDQILNLTQQAEQQTRQKLDKAAQPRRKQLNKSW